MLDAIKAEINAVKRLKSSRDFYYALGHGFAVSEIIRYAHDVRNLGMNRDFLVDTELHTWKLAAQFQLAAQDAYIGSDLGQALNKADHSREVGKGVALAYRSLCRAAGLDISDDEESYIEYRGHLHDGGRILNLAPQSLMTAIPTDEKRRSPIDVAMPAAEELFKQYGREIGDSAEEVAEAICFTAISDRKGPLFDAASKISPDVKSVVRAYFHKQDIHNPVYLRGFHSYSAHHDKVFGTGTDGSEQRGQFSNFSQHGALDHLAIIIDKVSAATGDAQSLDEIALWLVLETQEAIDAQKKGEDAAFDPRYARFILQDYGTGKSLLEQMHNAWVDGGYNRVPDGVKSLQRDRLLEVLTMSDDEVKAINDRGENPYPQLIGSWSALGADAQARSSFAASLLDNKSVASFVRGQALSWPQLTKNRAVNDLKVVQSQSLIYKLSFEKFTKRFSLGGLVNDVIAFAQRGVEPARLAA